MHAFDAVIPLSALIAAAAFAATLVSVVARRWAIPAPALFLAGGVVIGLVSRSAHRALSFEDLAHVAAVGLIVVLFDGGLSGGWTRARAAAVPILVLGVFGTLATTSLVALACHWLLGLGWMVSLLIGTALAPTDPAAVFSVLGSEDVGGLSGVIVEGESGANDPVGIALMIGLLAYAQHTGNAGDVVGTFALQMAVGLVVGLVVGRLLVALLRVVPPEVEVLYPIAALGFVFMTFAIAAQLAGSGFLAVFVVGLLLGDALTAHPAIRGFMAICSALAEITLFTIFGLTVTATLLTSNVGYGLAVFAILTCIVRPAVVASLLVRSPLGGNERAFVSWGGLKGAVPIVLAALPIIANVSGAQRVYGIVFVAVAASIVIQGSTIPWVVRRLDLPSRADDLRGAP